MEEMQEALRGKHEFLDSCVLSVHACAFSSDSLDEHTAEDEGSSQRDSSTIVSEFSSTKTLMNIEGSSARSSIREFYLPRKYSSEFQEEIKFSKTMSVNKVFKLESRNEFIHDTKESWLRPTTIPRTESGTSRKKQVDACRATGFSKSASQLYVTKQISNDETIFSEPSLENVKKKTKFDSRSRQKADVKMIKNGRTSHQNLPQNGNATKKLEKGFKEDHLSRSTVAKRRKEYSPSPPRRRIDDYRSKSESPSPTRIKRPRIAETTKEKSRSNSESGLKKLKRNESIQNQKSTNSSPLKKTYSSESSKLSKEKTKQIKKKIVLDFNEFPPPKSERRIQSTIAPSSSEELDYQVTHFSHSTEHPSNHFYLSPIEENSEASTSSSSQGKSSSKYLKSKQDEFTDCTQTTENYIFSMGFDTSRKYHTYPKSRIPVARKPGSHRGFGHLRDPKMYPLEPREIDLEAFQQLHTADSQDELQEFLLLESQCSGNLGLATNYSSSEISDHHSEDERGTMSGIF